MWCALVVAVLLVRVLPAVACEKSGSAAYVGTYVPEQWNPEGYVKVAERKAVLTWGPPLWMPARQLVAVRPDLFQMEDRAERQIRFERDGVGCVVAMTMGGGYSLDVALEEPKLAATVINYGHLATDPAELKKINAPILGLFGAKDQGIPPDSVEKFAAQLKELGKSVEVKIYPDAGHAFENPNNKNGYRAEDAADAWQRTVAFLAAHLKH